MESYILENGGIKARILNYGATITHLWVPDRDGNQRDVVLGFDDPREYEKVGRGLNPYFGAIIGRTCNRYKDVVLKLAAS